MPHYIDAHVHARKPGTPQFLQSVPIYTAYSAAVYMMNHPAPLDLSDANRAVDEVLAELAAINEVAKKYGNDGHVALMMPVMADIWTAQKLADFIRAAKTRECPIAGFKLFSPGQSTNSGYSPGIENAIPLIDAAAELNMPVAFHFEHPEVKDVRLKEAEAAQHILPKLLGKWKGKNKKFSFEHVSSAVGLKAAREFDMRYTITPQHLAFCLEYLKLPTDADAEMFLRENYPYHFCKPVINTMANMEELRAAWGTAVSRGDKRMMLGSDSAPHLSGAKDDADVMKRPAGVFMGDSRAAYEYAMGTRAADKLDDIFSACTKNAMEFYDIPADKLRPANAPAEPDLSEWKESERVMNVLKTRNLTIPD